MFCKLYETDLGQILVKKDSCEETNKPQLSFYFKPEGLGVCNFSATMPDDSDSSWGSLDKAFDSMTKDKSYLMVSDAIKGILD